MPVHGGVETCVQLTCHVWVQVCSNMCTADQSHELRLLLASGERNLRVVRRCMKGGDCQPEKPG